MCRDNEVKSNYNSSTSTPVMDLHEENSINNVIIIEIYNLVLTMSQIEKLYQK